LHENAGCRHSAINYRFPFSRQDSGFSGHPITRDPPITRSFSPVILTEAEWKDPEDDLHHHGASGSSLDESHVAQPTPPATLVFSYTTSHPHAIQAGVPVTRDFRVMGGSVRARVYSCRQDERMPLPLCRKARAQRSKRAEPCRSAARKPCGLSYRAAPAQ
jgi:hypothetical protein